MELAGKLCRDFSTVAGPSGHILLHEVPPAKYILRRKGNMSPPKNDIKTSSEESLSNGQKEGGVLNPAVQLEFLL